MKATAPQGLEASDYDELIAALDRRRQQLGLTMIELDARAGFPDGYSSHIFAWDTPTGRGLTRLGLTLMLGALRTKIVLVADGEAVQRPADAPRLNGAQLMKRRTERAANDNS